MQTLRKNDFAAVGGGTSYAFAPDFNALPVIRERDFEVLPVIRPRDYETLPVEPRIPSEIY